MVLYIIWWCMWVLNVISSQAASDSVIKSGKGCETGAIALPTCLAPASVYMVGAGLVAPVQHEIADVNPYCAEADQPGAGRFEALGEAQLMVQVHHPLCQDCAAN